LENEMAGKARHDVKIKILYRIVNHYSLFVIDYKKTLNIEERMMKL